jgi:hypothetical protein
LSSRVKVRKAGATTPNRADFLRSPLYRAAPEREISAADLGFVDAAVLLSAGPQPTLEATRTSNHYADREHTILGDTRKAVACVLALRKETHRPSWSSGRFHHLTGAFELWF